MRMTIAALLILITMAPPALAGSYTDGAWKGAALTDPSTGEFVYCRVKRENDAGEKLSFLLYFDTGAASGTLSLVAAVSSPALRLIKDKSYPGEILVDGKGVGADEEAKAIDTAAAMFFLPYEGKSFEMFSQGATMVAAMSGERVSFSLKGSRRALEWLKACTQRGIADLMRSRQPKAANSEDISREAMAMILDRAGLAGYVLNPPARSGGEKIRHEWTWNHVGGLQFYRRKAGRKFPDVFAGLIGKFNATCLDDPAPAIQIAKFDSGLDYGRASLVCGDGSSESRIVLIVVDNRDRVAVFMHVGRAEIAADVSAADEGVFAALRGIFD